MLEPFLDIQQRINPLSTSLYIVQLETGQVKGYVSETADPMISSPHGFHIRTEIFMLLLRLNSRSLKCLTYWFVGRLVLHVF